MVVTHVVSCGHVWPESLGRKMSLTFECVYLNMCCVLCVGGAAAARRRRRWAAAGVGAMRQWERGWERGVSVCLFVTICHCSKYAFIVVR